ncbi:ubiquitin carboxyl-terminal hydrolase 36-like isoform X2 [Dendronephthya gigantea]|uniref:ubiquitin carboxyl-terminal hydrolase 36-like isoform X2 n=1 Tax=Dendronephthya gigantea TaxID=151771 RepID=UPI00106994F1|nr:ubiquitin carboxyl-terminal hydrolase 36-like isoform X2 [Dendronephthya gigantea]
MSSVGIPINSKNYWKSNDLIDKKLGSVLDRKVASTSKQVLLDRIEFKEASKPDPFYQELKQKYTPLNSASSNQQTGNDQKENTKKKLDVCIKKPGKDELPSPKFVLFEKEKVHLGWKTVRSVGPGLFNLGNTCFLNSVIQVLTYTPPLVNYLATQEHSRTCATVGFCMLCELQRHVVRTFSHNQNQAIKPLAILQKLKFIAKHLRFGHQEDSHEFLRYVIDGMMKSCLSGVSEKLDSYTKATTMVHQVFGGYYRSQVICEKCHHTSTTYDPLMEVLLDIKHTHSVVNAMHKLVSSELLNGENLYLCPRCKRKVPAKKNLRVHQPPNVMTMCLKRFDSHSFFASKINKEVSYPEQLNLRPFMSTNQGPAVPYKLYAVLVHCGYSCNSGHYYCFIKAANNHWYQMNDSSVRQVNLKTVLCQQAYLLFYIKEHNIHKEKTNSTQKQPARNSCTNSTEGFHQKQHSNAPKVISERSNKDDKTAAQQFPAKRPESSWKASVETNKQLNLNHRPTSIPQRREKVVFALNHGLKKPQNTAEEKELETKEDNLKTDTKSSQHLQHDNRTSFEGRSEKVGEKLQVNEVSSSVVDDKNNRSSSASDTNYENKSTDKAEQKDTKTPQDVHATTKWTVTKNSSLPTALLPGALLPGGRERTPSMSSELSNPGSVASKTGDWAVCDRSSTQDMIGPRLPERQHAGWKVSTADSAKKDGVNGDFRKSEQTAGDDSDSQQKKHKHRREKHKRKKSRSVQSEDETKLLSDEFREGERSRGKAERLKKLTKAKKRKKAEFDRDESSGEDEEKKQRKRHKKLKKKKKHKRSRDSEAEISSSKNAEKVGAEKNLNSSQESLLTSKSDINFDADSENKLHSRKKDRKRDKKDSDRKHGGKILHESASGFVGKDESLKENDDHKTVAKKQTCFEKTDSNCIGLQNGTKEKGKTNGYDSPDDKFRTNCKKVGDFGKSLVGKGKEVLGDLKGCRKRDRRDNSEQKPLVQYSDDSTSEEQCEGSRGESRNRGYTHVDNRGEKDSRHKTKSPEISRENVNRKGVVDTLLGNSRKSSKYGRLVERWDGERDESLSDRDTDGHRKRRRDIWDEEYDRGKVKRTKNRHKYRDYSHHGESSFQREYDRRFRKENRHSTSSSGWHKRSYDRHSRRDRR